jgi:hypothetical protein
MQQLLWGVGNMKKMIMALLAIGLPIVPMPSAHGGDGLQSFGFNADSISGFPTGAAFLTGGGAYDPRTLGSTKFLHAYLIGKAKRSAAYKRLPPRRIEQSANPILS